MRWALMGFCLAPLATTLSVAQPETTHWPGVSNIRQSEEYYILQCRGCHRPEGGGSADTTPNLSGQVSQFLKVEGGRQYLGRVPGIAMAPLDDVQLAELLNWTLYRFDRENLPADFVAYTAAEVGRLRRAPLRTDALRVRRDLIARLDQQEPGRQRNKE